MANLLTNASFEVTSDWISGGGDSSYSSEQAFTGSRSWRFNFVWGFGGGPSNALVYQQVSILAGQVLPLSAFVFPALQPSGGDVFLSGVYRASGSLTWTVIGDQAIYGTGWRNVSFGSVSLGAYEGPIDVGFFAQTGAIPGFIGTRAWYIDAAQLLVSEAESMAVFLAELPRKALLATLVTHLNSELGKIERERNDGLHLPPVTRWFGFRRGTQARRQVQGTECEVYRDRSEAVTFPQYERFQLGHGSGILTHESRLVVALTYNNLRRVSNAQVQDLSERYEAAIARVIRDNPQLGLPDGVTTCVLRSSEASSTEDASDRITQDTILVSLRVLVQESASNEGVVGGGIPPSIDAEQR